MFYTAKIWEPDNVSKIWFHRKCAMQNLFNVHASEQPLWKSTMHWGKMICYFSNNKNKNKSKNKSNIKPGNS